MVADQVSGLVKCSEFKIHGGHITDFDSDLSSNNPRKKIDEGLAERFTRLRSSEQCSINAVL